MKGELLFYFNRGQPAFPKGMQLQDRNFNNQPSLPGRSQSLLAENPMRSAANPEYTLGYLTYHTIVSNAAQTHILQNLKPDPGRKTSDPIANACSCSTPCARRGPARPRYTYRPSGPREEVPDFAASLLRSYTVAPCWGGTARSSTAPTYPTSIQTCENRI